METSEAAPTRTVPSIEDLGPRFAAFVEGLTAPVVFFDAETTGTDPVNDRMIELSIVRVAPPPVWIEAPRTWRINPGIPIPVESTKVHGIADEDVVDAPKLADLADEILGVLDGADFAGFNIGRFDMRLLQAEFSRIGREVDFASRRFIDSQVIFHQREPRNLGAALRFYRDKELVDAHGAEADTLATLEVFAGQLARYEDLSTDVTRLYAESNVQNEAFCDLGRKLAWREDEPVFNFGRLRGIPLRTAASDPKHREYLKRLLESNFEQDMKAIIREALAGQIRRRTVAPAAT